MKVLRALLAQHRRQRGQVLVMVAAGMVGILGFVALSTDVGLYLRDLRDAQNDADAAALAGAQAFMLNPPDSATAVQLADEWATNNGAGGQVVWTGDGNCGTTPSGGPIPWGVSDSNGDGDPDTICLRIERSASAMFARVLGIDSFPVKRRAAARAVHSNRGAVCPWALRTEDPSDTNPSDGTYLGVQMGKIYAVKVGANASEQGNFGILRLYGPGKDDYKAAIASGCSNNGYNAFTEGDFIVTESEPGNVGNPTMDKLAEYFGYELSDGNGDGQGFGWCDVPMDWDETAMIGAPTGYNPAEQGARAGCGTDAANGRSGRYMLIPIVDKYPPPGSSGTVQILAIANVYVVGWGEWDQAKDTYDRKVPGGHAKVYVQFIENAPFKPKDLTGVSDNPLAPLRIMLIR